MTLICKQAHIG